MLIYLIIKTEEREVRVIRTHSLSLYLPLFSVGKKLPVQSLSPIDTDKKNLLFIN